MPNEQLPQTMEQRVAERVGSEIMSLIGEEQWNKLVASQVQHFMQNELPKLIQQQLRAAANKQIAAEFTKPEWQKQWDNYGKEHASQAVRDLLVTGAPEIFAAAVMPIVSSILYDLRNRLDSGSF